MIFMHFMSKIKTNHESTKEGKHEIKKVFVFSPAP